MGFGIWGWEFGIGMGFRISDLRFWIGGLESGVWDLGLISDLGFEIWDFGSGGSDLGSGVWSLGFGILIWDLWSGV